MNTTQDQQLRLQCLELAIEGLAAGVASATAHEIGDTMWVDHATVLDTAVDFYAFVTAQDEIDEHDHDDLDDDDDDDDDLPGCTCHEDGGKEEVDPSFKSFVEYLVRRSK